MVEGMKDETTVLPALLSAEALRQRLRPNLGARSFRNWLWRAITDQGFPKGVRIGERSCAWREDEVLAWLESRERGGRFDGKRPASAAGPGRRHSAGART
jgi:hypothetical protein